jgi:hypothetical protein
MTYSAFQDLLLELMDYIASGLSIGGVRPSLNPMMSLKIIIFEVERKKKIVNMVSDFY